MLCCFPTLGCVCHDVCCGLNDSWVKSFSFGGLVAIRLGMEWYRPKVEHDVGYMSTDSSCYENFERITGHLIVAFALAWIALFKRYLLPLSFEVAAGDVDACGLSGPFADGFSVFFSCRWSPSRIVQELGVLSSSHYPFGESVTIFFSLFFLSFFIQLL